MRIVTLEEHFTVPELVRRLDRTAVVRRGFPPPDIPWGPMRQADRLAELGPERLADMDRAGISLQVLSVSGPGADVLAPDEGPAVARAFNDALARVVAEQPNRYAGFAHLPMTAPEAAADELERCITQLGFCGALINGMIEDRFLDDPRFAPVLDRAHKLNAPIYLHPGIPPEAVRNAYYSGLTDPFNFMLSTSAWGWHAEVAVHVLRLALSGTLDRYPRLQLIIGHMGEGLPAMLARCDQVTARAPAGMLPRSVSQTILDHVHVTTSGFFSLAPFEALLHTFGADRIMFSVDYPFSENAAGRAFLDGLPVSPTDWLKIAHGNADRLLRLKT
jgi:predicted TIM-barrel fold metal-dependent hydrolase